MPLTPEEKARIKEEEEFRTEIRNQTDAKLQVTPLRRMLRLITGLITMGAFVIGFVGGFQERSELGDAIGYALYFAFLPALLFGATFINRLA